ncbi:MAG: hypothetical protein ACRDY6_08675 [Acidimicrobiia bacterium]
MASYIPRLSAISAWSAIGMCSITDGEDQDENSDAQWNEHQHHDAPTQALPFAAESEQTMRMGATSPAGQCRRDRRGMTTLLAVILVLAGCVDSRPGYINLD